VSPAFHDLHRRAETLLLPNAWDHASAAAFARAGFPAIGTTSLGVASAAGLVDGTGASREQMIALALGLCGHPWMVSADIEGGYSDDPAAVAELCVQLEEAGVAGVNLEDGRADGSLRRASHHADIVRAVAAAAPGLFVNARIDTAWLRAGDLEATLRRAAAYVDAGADGLFVPGLADPREIERAVAASPVPFNALLTSDGLTVAQLSGIGVARVSCGSLLYRIALGAAAQALDRIAASADVAGAPQLTYEQVQGFAQSAVQ
jgi:2-methylisocitrate lyase-like PEP mutase family enzyme